MADLQTFSFLNDTAMTARIVNGSFVELGELPYQVFLTNGGTFFCGGALLSSLLVITAAHCLAHVQTRFLRVVAGTNDRALLLDSAPTEQVRTARFIYSHESYHNTTMDNDIALVALSSPLKLTAHIGLLSLPEEREEFSNSTVVSGWGYTEEGGYASTILKRINLTFIPEEECGRRYAPRRRPITDNMLCALGEGDSCQGDSGGPAVCTRAMDNPKDEHSTLSLCGKVSFGYGCDRPEIPGVYTKVSNYVEWVEGKLIEINNRSQPCDVNCSSHRAVRRNNKAELSRIIEDEREVHLLHLRNRDGWTPLHTVADIESSEEAVDVAIRLLANGADAFAQDGDGNTFLHLLLHLKRVTPEELGNITDYLINNKLRTLFNVKGGRLGATLLQVAAERVEVDREILHLLYTSKLDFNAMDRNGNNLLAHAIMGRRSSSLIQQLVNLRVKWKLVNKRGESLLHVSAKYGNLPAAKYFAKGLDVNLLDAHGYSPLHRVAKSGTRNVVDMANFLLSQGASVTRRNRWGESPLDIACDREDDSPFKWELLRLLQRNASSTMANLEEEVPPSIGRSSSFITMGRVPFGLNSDLPPDEEVAVNFHGPKSSSGIRPVEISASSRSFSPTNYPADFDVEKRDTDGNTELHLAAGRGDEAAVRELVGRGADLNVQNNYDETPLQRVTWRATRECGKSDGTSCLNVVNFLVEQGAQDIDRFTFLHTLLRSAAISPTQLRQLARKYGHLFGASSDSGVTPLDLALAKVDMAILILMRLYDGGINFKVVTNQGYTVIVYAVMGHQSVEVLSKLIEFEADYERLDNTGRSLLHWAAYYGDVDALAFFIREGGLDVNGANNKGRTPLHLAGENSASKTLAVVRLLLDNGAEKGMEDAEGNSPYHKMNERQDFPDKQKVLDLLR